MLKTEAYLVTKTLNLESVKTEMRDKRPTNHTWVFPCENRGPS